MSEQREASSLIAIEKQSHWLIDQMQGQVDEEKGKNCKNEVEAEAKIAEYLKRHSETGQYEYLVRGATLVCSNGSHKRKVNLPKCHGVYIGDHPLLHKFECVSEYQCGIEQCNITFFGVCIPEDGEPPQTEIKTYLKEEKNSSGGLLGPITGHKCQPVIVGCWNDTYYDTRIVDNGDKCSWDRNFAEKYGKNMAAGECTVTTGSFLVCKYGGLIQPINSGQKTRVLEQDFYNSEDFEKVVCSCRAGRKTPVEKNEG